MRPNAWIPAIAALLVAAAAPLEAAVFYVTPAGTGDGATPATATNLQAALAAAAANGQEDDLKLAAGTYSAAAASFVYDVTGDAATGDTGFYAQGGYSADFATRSDDPALTVLDGGNARRVLFVDARRADRAPDIGFGSVTFTRGLATDGVASGHGGAILGLTAVSSGVHGTLELSLYGCDFVQNAAPLGYGGAIYLVGAVIAGGTDFVGNAAVVAGAVWAEIYDWDAGDGVHRHDHAVPASFEWGEFRDNASSAVTTGPVAMRVNGNALTLDHVKVLNTTGADLGNMQTIAAYESTVKIEACQFRDNTVARWASAIDLIGSSATITNSLFEGNWAGTSGTQGGGLFSGYNLEFSGHPYAAETLTITNCTFVGNKGTAGLRSILDLQAPQSATFTNCIFTGNEQAVSGSASLRNSRLDGTPAADGFGDGGNNLTAVPSFQAGDEDYKLNWDSPLIDRGDNAAVPVWMTEDFKGAVRVFANRNREVPVVDMGWDEYIDWTLNLTAPSPGVSWLNDGSVMPIVWDCRNIGGNLNVSLWKGAPEALVFVRDIVSQRCDDALGESYQWPVPADLDGADYAIVASPALYPTIERTVTPLAIQHLRLTWPSQGKLYQGTTYAITWDAAPSHAAAPVRLELCDDLTPVRTIAAAAPNTGSYQWKVPFTVAPSDTARVRVSTASPAAEDVSDRLLRVLPAITLAAPNGGQVWKRGTTQVIRWSYRNSPGTAVRLDLYKGGVFDRAIVASTPIGSAGAGSYAWAIPATLRPGTAYTVRVRSASFPKVFDFGNKVFTITR